MDATDFPRFFQTLWSLKPHSWQTALAERVVSGQPWPEALGLGTSMGKTSSVDIAVFKMAVDAERLKRGDIKDLIRRIIYIVNRRIVVDTTYERAQEISKKLKEAKDGILKEVADNLRFISGSDEPLLCAELRGGIPHSHKWRNSPLQATFLSTTVDQVGSRILFRGYGSSYKTWPIEAALMANGSLYLLDEIHSIVPFVQTMEEIRRYRGRCETEVSIPYEMLVMSATPPSRFKDVFRDTSGEARDPNHLLGRRCMAPKNMQLKTISAPSKNPKTRMEKMGSTLANEAISLMGSDNRAVVVFCNTVRTARTAYQTVKQKMTSKARVILLTGKMRSLDKDEITLHHLEDLNCENSEGRILTQPTFVITTQCLELGADLDFDLVATECASLDALMQRLGRKDRLGLRTLPDSGTILTFADILDDDYNPDPIYGKSAVKTWQWLNDNAINSEINLGINSIEDLMAKEGKPRDDLNAPTPDAPILLPAHLDCLVQTSPIPGYNPDITPFLHGKFEHSADVYVCFRGDLDFEQGSEDDNIEAVKRRPPSSMECFPVPVWEARAWAIGGTEDDADEQSDVMGVRQPDRTNQGSKKKGEKKEKKKKGKKGKKGKKKKEKKKKITRKCIRWKGKDSSLVKDIDEIVPGITLVIDACDENWRTFSITGTPEQPFRDEGDQAHARHRGEARLTLHPTLLREWPDCLARDTLIKLCEGDLKTRWENDQPGLIDDIRYALRDVPPKLGWVHGAAGTLANDEYLIRNSMPHPLKGIILTGSHKLIPGTYTRLPSPPGKDPSRLLCDHLGAVQEWAEKFCSLLPLPEKIKNTIIFAAKYHDIGKADPRNQAIFNDGLPVSGELLAKSSGRRRTFEEQDHLYKKAAFPRGARHEFLSVALLESDPTIFEGIDEELAKALILAHHGQGSPFARVVEDDAPVIVDYEVDGHTLRASSATEMERLDSGVSDRFWNLTRKYGWWGFAYLRALVCLADYRGSAGDEVDE